MELAQATARPPQARQAGADPNLALRQAVQAIEAGFLAEMLKAARVGEPPTAFGGGIGEDQFASFLREEQARLMVDRGGIGLAETLYQAMVRHRDG